MTVTLGDQISVVVPLLVRVTFVERHSLPLSIDSLGLLQKTCERVLCMEVTAGKRRLRVDEGGSLQGH